MTDFSFKFLFLIYSDEIVLYAIYYGLFSALHLIMTTVFNCIVDNMFI